MDRAPTWHKFNLMAFYPKMGDDDVIRVSPLIVRGFNMDFDGDQVNFHVPVSDKAVAQAKSKMLPSKSGIPQKFDLPRNAWLLNAIVEQCIISLYFVVNVTNELEERSFVVYDTEQEIVDNILDELVYISSIRYGGDTWWNGATVSHLFEIDPRE